jgi:hypothetical protein
MSWTPCFNWLENTNQHTTIALFGTSWGIKFILKHIYQNCSKGISVMQYIKQYVLRFKPRNGNQNI